MVALLASAQALAAQIVVVFPACLGIDEQPPLSFVSFRHSWHNKLLSGLCTEIAWAAHITKNTGRNEWIEYPYSTFVHARYQTFTG